MTTDTETLTPLYSIEHEAEVIGSLLWGNRLVEPAEIMKILPTEEMFYNPRHRQIYRAILAVANEEAETVELSTVLSWIEKNGSIRSVGGAAHLVELKVKAEYTMTARHSAKEVRGKYIRRRVAATADRLAEFANDTSKSPEEIISYLHHEAQNVTSEHIDDTLLHISDVTGPLISMVQDFQSGHANQYLVPTGLTDVDMKIVGFSPGQMVIIGGDTGEGKTSLALQIAHVTANSGKAAMIFSLEMRPIELYLRMACTESRIDSMQVRRKGELVPRDYDKLIAAMRKLESLPLYFDEGYDKSIPAIRAKIQRFQAQKPLALAIIDYIGLVQPHRRSENRAVEMTYISRDIKRIALEFNIPIIAIAQSSRAAATRADKSPVLSDLKDSSAIEQDADIVMFVGRKKDSVSESLIYVRKNRNGSCGQVEVYYDRTHTRFDNIYNR